MFSFNQNNNGPYTPGNPKETELYDLLEVKPDVNDEDLKKSYKIVAKKVHPDKNPDNREEATIKFQKVNQAFKILSDPQKRQIYDTHGMKGIESTNGGGGDEGGENPFDMFQNIFGGGGFPFGGFNERMTRQKPKPPPTKHKINITLADLYTGKDYNIKLNQQSICKKCQGSGANNPSSIKRCSTCNGKGQVNQLRQVGPGMLQQTSQTCGKCKGKGKIIEDPKDICSGCNGERVVKNINTIKITIKPGMNFGMAIQMNNKGDEIPDLDEPGDLVVIPVECGGYNPSNLKRKENNLHMNVDLSLVEALCGFKLVICQLDGRKLIIDHNGKIIQPNEVMKIKNEGMPHLDKPSIKGDLYIHFNIILPKNLDNSRKDIIKQVLPSVKRNNHNVLDSDKQEVKHLEEAKDYTESTPINQNVNDFSEMNQDFGMNMGGMGAPPGVQCAQQ